MPRSPTMRQRFISFFNFICHRSPLSMCITGRQKNGCRSGQAFSIYKIYSKWWTRETRQKEYDPINWHRIKMRWWRNQCEDYVSHHRLAVQWRAYLSSNTVCVRRACPVLWSVPLKSEWYRCCELRNTEYLLYVNFPAMRMLRPEQGAFVDWSRHFHQIDSRSYVRCQSECNLHNGRLRRFGQFIFEISWFTCSSWTQFEWSNEPEKMLISR